jgi:hypothetical protein
VLFADGVASVLPLRSGASARMILLDLTARMSLEEDIADAVTALSSAGPRRALARG